MAKYSRIVVQVINAASSEARKIAKDLRDIGGATKSTQLDLIGFNRILFSTTAFVSIMQRRFSSLFNVMDKGADLDRLRTQFERNLGPTGKFFGLIAKFTDTTVDRFQALKSALELANLGIVSSAEGAAHVIGEAGTAAKRAGFDAATGIKEYTEFMKDGSIAHLENIGLINRSNLSLVAQQKILNATGGTMGSVISLMARLELGQWLLSERTAGLLHGNRDLADSMLDIKQSFTFLGREVGIFLGTGLAPLFDKISSIAYKTTDFIQNLTKTHKGVVELAKAFLVAVVSIGGFLTTLLVVQNVAKGIAMFGMPNLLIGLALASSAFLGAIHPMDKFTSNLQFLSRFIRDVGQEFIIFGHAVVNIMTFLGGLAVKGFNLLPLDKIGNWTKPLEHVRHTAVQLTAVFAALFGLGKLLPGTIGSRLTNIPGIGGIFSIFSGRPKGTASDPIHVVGAGMMGAAAVGGGIPLSFDLYGIGMTLLKLGGKLAILSTFMDLIGAIAQGGSFRQMAGGFVKGTGLGGVGTILGAIIGAVMGIPGGPPGMIAGAIMGAGYGGLGGGILGMFGGNKLTDWAGDQIAGTDEPAQTDAVVKSTLAETQEGRLEQLGSWMSGLEGARRKEYIEALKIAVREGGLSEETMLKLHRKAFDTSLTGQSLQNSMNGRGSGQTPTGSKRDFWDPYKDFQHT